MSEKDSKDVKVSSKSSTLSVLRDAFAFWKEFDLTNRRNALDSQAFAIAAAQENTSQGRKNLSERTKEFRRLEDDEKLQNLGPLLKAYQKQVDEVTKRAKESEKAFLALYQALNVGPDPRIALEYGVVCAKDNERTEILEREKAQLEQTIKSYKDEFAELRSQEVTIRELEEKLHKYEENMKRKVDEMVQLRENEIQEELRIAQAVLSARETELENHFKAVNDAVRASQMSKESAEKHLIELKGVLEREREARKQVEDLDDREEYIAQNLQKFMIEKESIPQKENDNEEIVNDLKTQISQQEGLIEAIQDQLAEEQSRLEKETENKDKEIRFVADKLEKEKEKVASLQSDLESRPLPAEIEDLKKQIRVLQATVVDAVEEEDQTKMPLEAMLMKKNRKLGSDITRCRGEVASLTQNLDKMHHDLEEERMKNENLTQLVSKLEDDLLKSQSNEESSNADASISEVWGSTPVKPALLSSSTPISTPSNPKQLSDMLRIVTAQRDRFRSKVESFESQVVGLQGNLADQLREVEQLREDNVKLFEKIRFLQSYGKKGDDSLEAGTSKYESKYSGLYEAKMNPFAEFSHSERQRRIQDLGATDRVTLRVGQVVMTSKGIRTFIFFYSILLHVLVFLTLYYMARRSNVQC